MAHNGVYRALIKIFACPLGYPDCEAENCVPYLFQPQKDVSCPWLILSVKDPGDGEDKRIIEGRRWFHVRSDLLHYTLELDI